MKKPLIGKNIITSDLENIISHKRKLQEQNIGSIIHLLNMKNTSVKDCENDKEIYLKILKQINPDSISIKPTQLGLLINKSFFEKQYKEIIKEANKNDTFVWLDMEEPEYIQETIDVYTNFLNDYKKIGICLQANVRRTENYFGELVSQGGTIRLVKGAFNRKNKEIYSENSEINIQFKNYVHEFKHINNPSSHLAIGTHDEKLIDYSLNVLREEPEIQMLMGVRDNYQKQLAKNHNVKQFIPYGSKVMHYYYRVLFSDSLVF